MVFLVRAKLEFRRIRPREVPMEITLEFQEDFQWLSNLDVQFDLTLNFHEAVIEHSRKTCLNKELEARFNESKLPNMI